MKKYLISATAIFVVLALVLSVSGQPAGGGGGGRGQGGGGFGGGMGMGGGMGGRGGMRRAVERPDRAARLDAIKQLETQITALKAAIEKAPAKDPNIANLEGEALTKFMDVYTPESDAINAIQQTLSTLRGGGARGGRGGGASEDVLSELRVLAQKEKATKTVARLDALIQEAQNRTNRRGAGGFGGGQFGGGQGGGGQRRGQQ